MGVASERDLEATVLSANTAAYRSMTSDARAEAVQQLAAVIAAAHAELLDVVAAVDAESDWVEDGTTGVVPWLVGNVGLARRNASEWVRVSTALQHLPALRAAYARGALSWDQVRPATRFVTPDDDAHWAEVLPGHTAAQIELLARQRRPVPDTDAQQAHANRGFSWRRDHRAGGFRYRGFLPFDQGAALNGAIDRIADQWGPDATSGQWAPAHVRRADALHDLATRRLAADPAPDRACVVIHADASVVDGDEPGNGFIGDLAVARSGVLRAMCDARVEVALHGEHGATVGVARASQTIPAWLRRQIRQIHHIEHWSQGGTTNADNLIGLCWDHHHLVHEGGWRIEGDPNGSVAFVSPAGRRVTTAPQAIRAGPRQRLLRLAGLEPGEAATTGPGR